MSQVTNSHILPTPLYGHWLSAHVYFHYQNYVIIVDIVRCSDNDRFLRVNKILSLEKQKQNSVTYLILNRLPFFRCLTLVLRDDREVPLNELVTVTVEELNNVYLVKLSAFVFISIKHVFFDSPLNTDTRIIRTLWHVPLVSRINRVPL